MATGTVRASACGQPKKKENASYQIVITLRPGRDQFDVGPCALISGLNSTSVGRKRKFSNPRTGSQSENAQLRCRVIAAFISDAILPNLSVGSEQFTRSNQVRSSSSGLAIFCFIVVVNNVLLNLSDHFSHRSNILSYTTDCLLPEFASAGHDERAKK